MLPTFFSAKTKLDRAILLSLAAMLTMNLFVMAQQLQADPVAVVAQNASATRQA